MYQLQNIDYLYRISTMTGLSKLVTIQADRNLHDLNDKHFVMLNVCHVSIANDWHGMWLGSIAWRNYGSYHSGSGSKVLSLYDRVYLR